MAAQAGHLSDTEEATCSSGMYCYRWLWNPSKAGVDTSQVPFAWAAALFRALTL